MEYENIYLIKMSDEFETFYKIGLTVHRYCRFYQLMKHGYDVEIIYMSFGLDCYDAFDAESGLQDYFSYSRHTPKKKFGGYMECFTQVDVDIFKEELKQYITKPLVRHINPVEGLKITWR